MRRNYSKAEIKDLILDLASDDPEVADSAMSDLLMMNSRRCLAEMIAALDWGDNLIKQRICYIFGGLTDERCVDPLLAMLNEANVDTQLAAIDSLQYFPLERVVPQLENHLRHEDENIRQAIISTLGVFVKRGVVDAHLPLANLVRNENVSVDLRRLALLNMQHLEEAELKSLLISFDNISDATIYSHILLLQDGLDKNPDQKIAETEQLIQKLLAEKDVLKQIRIEDRLITGGSITAKVLIKKIFAEPDNALLRVHARMMFNKMGRKAISAFKHLFETFDQFYDIRQVVLLQDLIMSIQYRQFSPLSKSLVNLLERINSYIETVNSEDRRRDFELIKPEIHFALSIYGCREGVADMKKIMLDGTERQYLSLIEALKYVGDKDFLIPLINQLQAYRDFRSPIRAVKQAFKAIVHREKITWDDPIFDNLSDLQKQNLTLIMKR